MYAIYDEIAEIFCHDHLRELKQLMKSKMKASHKGCVLFRSACRLHLLNTKQRKSYLTTIAQIWEKPLLQTQKNPCFTLNLSQKALCCTRPSPTANPPRFLPESTSSETRGSTLSKHGRENPVSATDLENPTRIPTAWKWELFQQTVTSTPCRAQSWTCCVYVYNIILFHNLITEN